MSKIQVDTKYKITILGCGPSGGVPKANCDWGDCNPNEPKNYRTRSSILINRILDNKKTTVVVDTGGDFRYQAIKAGITHIDGVIYTHHHADHTAGIDDLRSFTIAQHELIKVYSTEETYNHLKERNGYCFETPVGSNYPPILKNHLIKIDQDFIISGQGGDIRIKPFLQKHGNINSLALRVKNFAYCTDVSEINQQWLEQLKGVEYLVLGALQYNKHPSHLSVEQALEAISIVEPKKSYLTHMHYKLDYNNLKCELPENVEPCYDGLSFYF